jgi:putative ABC transport system substrate-binding protein
MSINRSQRPRLVVVGNGHRIPAAYFRREFPDAGGLMSYGTSVMDALRQIGVYATRILKGDRPTWQARHAPCRMHQVPAEG